MNYLWTIREAAAIADIPAKAIRQMIEREDVRPYVAPERRRGASRLVSTRDLVFLKLLAEFPFALEKAHKAALEALVRRRRSSDGDWQAEGQELVLRRGELAVRVDCGRMREMLLKNAAAFLWGQRRIVSDQAILGGEPIFRGTSVALSRVEAAIRGGASEDYLAGAFPVLSEADLDYARIHARMGNRPGRPRKPLATRRAEQAA